MYPPDLSIRENVEPFLQAMRTAGVPKSPAGRMLDIFVKNNGTLVERLTAVRDQFNMSKEGAILLFKCMYSNNTVLQVLN